MMHIYHITQGYCLGLIQFLLYCSLLIQKGQKYINELKTATYFLHHELGVALSTSNNHVHPDPHGFRRGSDHIINSVVSLYAEGERGIWALDQRQEENSETGHVLKTEQKC